MKKSILNLSITTAVFALCLSVFSSCKKLEELTPLNFSVDGAAIELTVPAGTTTALSLNSAIALDLDALAKQYNFDKKDVKKIKFKEVTANIVDTDSLPYTFNLVQSFEAYVKATGKTDVTVITDNNIEQTNATEIKLDVLDSDIKDMLNANQFDFNLKGALANPVAHQFKIVLKIKYDIEASVLK